MSRAVCKQVSKARLVRVALPRVLPPSDLATIEAFLAKWPPEDITCRVRNHTLELSLRALDLQAFGVEADQIASHGSSTLFQHRTPVLSEAGAATLRELVAQIASIHSFGVKAGKRLYVGYADERKVKGRKAKVANRAKHFYAIDSSFPTTNQVLPADLCDNIICADSLNYLATLPENSIDLIFTSPPYNFGLDYSSNHDTDHWQQYFDRLFAIFDQCIRVLKYAGRFVVNVQPLFSDYIPSHHLVSSFLMRRKLIWKGEILWEKNNYNCKYTAWGSWRSPSNPYLKYTWEFLEVFAKGSLQKPGHSGDADMSADEFKKWVVGRWSIAPEREMKAFGHPAMFPEELATRVIKLFSYRGDVVLDPFNGAGTTTLVAKKLGRRYIGIDISPVYCETARRRMSSLLF